MELQLQIAQIFPKYEHLIMAEGEASDSTWKASLSTGKALEFISLLMIISGLEEIGATVVIDPLFWANPDYFYLRNEVPFHHGAQAGHAGSLNEHVPLADRFLCALTPRASIHYDAKRYLLFREGNPLHLITQAVEGGASYKERPDIVLVGGSIDVGITRPGKLGYKHEDPPEEATAELQIKNTNLLPISNYDSSTAYEIRTFGVIECSVSKTESHVNNQLNNYIQLFSSSQKAPETLFIHGSPGRSIHRTLNIDINNIAGSISSPEAKSLMASFLAEALN